jgi:hypothetical protein
MLVMQAGFGAGQKGTCADAAYRWCPSGVTPPTAVPACAGMCFNAGWSWSSTRGNVSTTGSSTAANFFGFGRPHEGVVDEILGDAFRRVSDGPLGMLGSTLNAAHIHGP